MIKFDLEKARAGDVVVDIKGNKVQQLTIFEASESYVICGVLQGSFRSGLYEDELFMAPKMGKGFMNVYLYHDTGEIYPTKREADEAASHSRSMCIDLSQFPEDY